MQAAALSVEGRPAQVLRGGRGPALLLLHLGGADARLCWEAAFPALAERFEVLAPDLPGFGGTAALPAPSFGALARWLEALLESLGVKRAAVAGTSFGATVGRVFAAEAPARVSHLVLSGGGAVQRPSFLGRWVMKSFVGEALVSTAARNAYGDAELARMFARPEAAPPALVAALRASAPAAFSLLRALITGPPSEKAPPAAPSLILWGAQDRHAPQGMAERLAREIPGATLRTVEGAGHLVPVEQPAAFARAVISFAAAHG